MSSMVADYPTLSPVRRSADRQQLVLLAQLQQLTHGELKQHAPLDGLRVLRDRVSALSATTAPYTNR